MAELPSAILAEKENIEQALKNLSEAMNRPKKSIIELCRFKTLA